MQQLGPAHLPEGSTGHCWLMTGTAVRSFMRRLTWAGNAMEVASLATGAAASST
jgi:hypothetical protein